MSHPLKPKNALPPEAQDLARRIAAWHRDPVLFVREVFGAEPDAWQARALSEYAAPGERVARVALQACAGPGKTTVLAWVLWHALMTCGTKGSHPKGAAFAVTAANLRDNLWAELAKWRSRSPLLQHWTEWTSERVFVKEHPETWFISARTWSKSASPEEQGRTLSGLHGEYVIVVGDEVGDVPLAVLRVAEQALSECRWGRVVVAGNPTSRTGMLYEVATRLRDQWRIVRVTGDPEDPERSPRISAEWASEQIRLYGRENPWVQAYILGQFPTQGLNTLLTLEEIEDATRRHLRPDAYEWSQVRLGVDVARFGDDETVIACRQGLASWPAVVLRGARTTEIAGRVLEEARRRGAEVVFVDDTGGWGAGVVDALLQAGVNVVPVNFSGKAQDPRYYNVRSEIWFRMAEWVKRGGALPDDPLLASELASPIYAVREGRFWLEDKEHVKKRLRRSPDRADALALTFALPDVPSGVSTHGATQRGHSSDDPFVSLMFARPSNPQERDYNPIGDEWLRR